AGARRRARPAAHVGDDDAPAGLDRDPEWAVELGGGRRPVLLTGVGVDDDQSAPAEGVVVRNDDGSRGEAPGASLEEGPAGAAPLSRLPGLAARPSLAADLIAHVPGDVPGGGHPECHRDEKALHRGHPNWHAGPTYPMVKSRNHLLERASAADFRLEREIS